MSLDIFLLSGYGVFVWPAFIFTFISCFILFIKTSKDLQKQEKEFLAEYGELADIKKASTKQEKLAKEVLSGSSV